MNTRSISFSAAAAMGWEIWHSHRRGFLWVIGALAVCAGLSQAFPAKLQDSDALQGLGFVPMAATLFAAFVFFNYTESDRRGRFGGFPSRLFTLPLPTWVLVTCPICYGVAAIVILYLAWANLIFAPAGIHLPVDWPCLYLAAGMIGYQTLIWTLARFRVLRLVALGVCGTLLATGWLIFSEDMADSFGAVLFPGNLDPPVKSLLMLGLGLMSLCGYAAALAAISSQRHGGGAARFEWTALWHTFTFVDACHAALPPKSDVVPDRTPGRPFSSAAAAQFWFEWRRHGFLLPASVGFVLALMMGPTLFMDQLGSEATVLILGWTFASPLVLSVAIGKGFGKPDLWSRDTLISPSLAMRPITCGDWVGIKLKAAAFSTGLAWVMVFASAVLWLIHRGDLAPIAQGWERFCLLYSGPRRSMILVLLPLCAVIITWRFLIAGLYSGMAARALMGSVSIVATFVLCFGALMSVLWFENHPGQFYRVLQALAWMPGLLGFLLCLKSGLAFWGWQKAYGNHLVTSHFVLSCAGAWLAGVALVGSLVWLLIPDITWLNRLLFLSAMALMPLARIAHSPGALAGNRHWAGQVKFSLAAFFQSSRDILAGARTRSLAEGGQFIAATACFALAVAGTGVVLTWQAAASSPRWVDAGGHRLRMSVQGSGTPAVVFEQFGAGTLEQWARIQRAVAGQTRAIAYDHGGYGGSEAGPKPRDARRIASELHAALRSAGIPPPYVFVGHSFGGPYSRVFADLYPDEIAGLVLLDPSQEAFFDWLKTWYPEANSASSESRAAQDEWGSAAISLEQARGASLPPIPVTVVTGMRAEPDEPERRRVLPVWLDSHQSWVAAVPEGRHMIRWKSAHGIPHDEPDFVIGLIRDMVRKAK